MRFPSLQISLLLLLIQSQALAWDALGHQTVGAIADRLIAGSHAAQKVDALLGGLSLEQASVWADCAKGIDPKRDYAYTTEGQYPGCKPFETAQGVAELTDYVRRNHSNCQRKAGEGSCHRQYHYTDVAIQHNSYRLGWVGTREWDVVHGLQAAIRVLQGEPAPPPFNLKNQREALLLLVHLVGDLHQPLHVGALYLDGQGRRLNPDVVGFEPLSQTQGGNRLVLTGAKGELHALWDNVSFPMLNEGDGMALIRKAKSVKTTDGDVGNWPVAWASDSVVAAKQAFAGITFGQFENDHWIASLPYHYDRDRQVLQKRQLIKAGTRLAQLLLALWPCLTVSKTMDLPCQP